MSRVVSFARRLTAILVLVALCTASAQDTTAAPRTRTAFTFRSARNVRPWARDVFASNGFVAQGTASQRYFCVVRRERRGASRKAACESREVMVH